MGRVERGGGGRSISLSLCGAPEVFRAGRACVHVCGAALFSSRCLRSVVLPVPRKPEMSVTGTGSELKRGRFAGSDMGAETEREEDTDNVSVQSSDFYSTLDKGE